jgi:O-antigen ligase/Flp pilus assembly protein TadD
MPNRLSRYMDGVMEACWLLALIVAPLFFNIYSSRVFEPDKISLVRSLAMLALAAWLVKLISLGGARFETVARPAAWRDWLRVPLLAPVAAFVLIYIISTALSISPSISLFGSYQRLQGLYSTFSYIALFFVAVANLRQRAQVERLLTTVVVTSLPVSLYGILQRYQLDPLPWGGDTRERVTGHMGNAIFLGAYLIMAAMAVLGRVVASFRAVMQETEGLAVNTIRAAIYIFIFAVNLVAIWFTQSRGPQLGLLAGLFFFFILLALHYRVRWLVLTTVGLAAATAAFLIVLNIPEGPLKGLNEVQGVGRLARMFDEIEGRTGTGRVRVLIWSGVVQLLMPHAPLAEPNGAPDIWNSLRPLIGYGPEALHVAYNRFYPPELGQLEARNASPDRSHNETFDALAFTGVIGLLVYLVLFIAVFYYSLKWLGLIGSARRRNMLLLLVVGGGALSAAGFVAWQGPEFFGVGLPLGMLVGLIAFMTLYALLPAEAGVPVIESWRAVAMISMFAAIVAYFTEIHFGIAIVSTRTHFWIYLGALVVLGWVFPRMAAAPLPEAAPAAAAPAKSPAARRRRTTSASPEAPSEAMPGVGATLGLLTALLVTLGFNFITNPNRLADPFSIVFNALTLLNTPQGTRASGFILGMILLTWLMGGALTYLEERRETRAANLASGLAAALGFSLAAALFVWMIYGSTLAAIARTVPQQINELIASVRAVSGVLALYYGLMFVALLAWAAALQPRAPEAGRARRASESAIAWLAATAAGVVVSLLAVTLNLQVIQADIIYKTGLQFDDQGQPQVAIPLFDCTLKLAPSQDFYYLFLGRAFLNASNAAAEVTLLDCNARLINTPTQDLTQQRNDLFRIAQEKLLDARDLNPYNTDHTANLARLNRQWAFLIGGTPESGERAQQADAYYAEAISLSPNNVGLWNEWGALKYQLLSDGAQAREKLERSLALDGTFDQTYQFLGDLYSWEAGRTTDAAVQQDYFQKAVSAYEQGVTAANTYRNTSLINIYLGLSNVYVRTNQIDPAINAYQQVAQLNAGPNQWQVYRALGELYRQKGDLVNARTFGQQALQAAPEANKQEVQDWLNTLPQ